VDTGGEQAVDEWGRSDGISNERKKEETSHSSSHTYLNSVRGREADRTVASQTCMASQPRKRKGSQIALQYRRTARYVQRQMESEQGAPP
jgi:hypothetical protein